MTWSGWRIATDGSDGTVVWLGLGSNQGDRREQLAGALRSIATEAGTVEAVSPVYETEPVGYVDQPLFWNLVVRITTRHAPAALLAVVKGIERRMGRTAGERWGPRPIDIDVLIHGAHTIDSADLCIPHPRMLERGFVLRPLADIDPDLLHPLTGSRIGDVLAAGRFEDGRRLFDGAELLGETA